MLSKSDISLEIFLPVFAELSVPVAFLVPTETGYMKSIMDATAPVRNLLLEAGVHDYTSQAQGPANKARVKSYFVYSDRVQETTASLYRPVTKKGDPRIWFDNLRKYVSPYNLLALIVLNGEIYVFNLSTTAIEYALTNKTGFAYSVLQRAGDAENAIAKELLSKIQAIHDRGFIPSVTTGDPGVGDTLENALGISRNNSRSPDYKGIELKASRVSREGKKKAKTRSTLFTKVPDVGLTYAQIVKEYGKWQTPRGAEETRLQMYETLRVSRPNAYDLILNVNENKDQLEILYVSDGTKKFVSAWSMQTLKDALLKKHRETFWVHAASKTVDGLEYFRYDKILHTKRPNVSLIAPLIQADIITIDLAAHYRADGSWRDHGVLFKIMPDKIPMLLGSTEEYIL